MQYTFTGLQNLIDCGILTFYRRIIVRQVNRIIVRGFNTKSSSYIPVRFRGLFTELCFVSGPKNITAIFRNSRRFPANANVIIAMDRLFGAPKHIIPSYEIDNTRVDATPNLHSNNVEPHHRIHHIVHAHVIKYLSGSGLKPLTTHFLEDVTKQISNSGIGSEWLDMPDLFEFCRVKLFHASIDAIFGPHLLTLNLDFVSDFWEFSKCTSYLLKGLPRFLALGSWAAREKCLLSLKRYSDYVSLALHFPRLRLLRSLPETICTLQLNMVRM
jgi:hypothetical protein